MYENEVEYLSFLQIAGFQLSETGIVVLHDGKHKFSIEEDEPNVMPDTYVSSKLNVGYVRKI